MIATMPKLTYGQAQMCLSITSFKKTAVKSFEQKARVTTKICVVRQRSYSSYKHAIFVLIKHLQYNTFNIQKLKFWEIRKEVYTNYNYTAASPIAIMKNFLSNCQEDMEVLNETYQNSRVPKDSTLATIIIVAQTY